MWVGICAFDVLTRTHLYLELADIDLKFDLGLDLGYSQLYFGLECFGLGHNLDLTCLFLGLVDIDLGHSRLSLGLECFD